MTINQRLFDMLEQKNIKMADLARYLDINKTVVSAWKNRGTNPPVEYTVQICELLKISIEYYITGNEIDKLLSNGEEELLSYYRQLPEQEQARELGRLEARAEQYRDSSQERLSESRTG